MEQDQRVSVRGSAELLNRGLWFNGFANWAVALAQVATTVAILYAWGG